MPLDINKTVLEITNLYNSSSTSKYFRALVFGDIGTGKTSLIRTARQPVHIDSFDPGGTKVLRDLIDQKRIIVDNIFEMEDPKNPSAITNYASRFKERKANGYFEYFGTYVIDSLTMMSQAAMNYVLRKRNRPDGIPETGKGRDNDYVVQQAVIEPMLKDIMSLPCDVVLIAHPDLIVDEDTNKKFIGPLITGQLKMRVPLMFDEVYCSITRQEKENIVYRLLTRPNGLYRCRSRLSMAGKLETFEEPDIKMILKKAGYPTDDKPIPWLETPQAGK